MAPLGSELLLQCAQSKNVNAVGHYRELSQCQNKYFDCKISIDRLFGVHNNRYEDLTYITYTYN